MNKAEQIKYSKRKKLIGKLFVIAVGINEYRLKGDNLNNCCTDAKVIFHTLKSYTSALSSLLSRVPICEIRRNSLNAS